jgi:hypothetical protein
LNTHACGFNTDACDFDTLHLRSFEKLSPACVSDQYPARH